MEELLEEFEEAIRKMENLNDELKDIELNNTEISGQSDEIEYALEDIRSSLAILELEIRTIGSSEEYITYDE